MVGIAQGYRKSVGTILLINKGVAHQRVVYDAGLQGLVGQCIVNGDIGIGLPEHGNRIRGFKRASVLVAQGEVKVCHRVGRTVFHFARRNDKPCQQYDADYI